MGTIVLTYKCHPVILSVHTSSHTMKTSLVLMLVVMLTTVCAIDVIEVPADMRDGCTDSLGSYHDVGSSYMSPDGCNRCNCVKRGFEACTMMMCPPKNLQQNQGNTLL